jgi:NADH:ubiquinone oxidoreductase subunit 3 (subunit A)
VLDKLGAYGLFVMAIFVVELIIGFFFVWKKGALEWE